MADPSRPRARPDQKQFRSLVAFVKTLPKPVEAAGGARAAAARGKELFGVGRLRGLPRPGHGRGEGRLLRLPAATARRPARRAGRAATTAAPRRRVALPPRPEDDPKPSEWKTPPLWGVADSAPYLHDGSAPTLESRSGGTAATPSP